MRTPLRITAVRSLVLGLVLAAGCTVTTANSDEPATDPSDSEPTTSELPGVLAARSDVPWIRGPITSIETTDRGVRVLVKAAPRKGNGPASSWVFPGNAVVVWRDGSAASVGDLRKGRKVMVWTRSPVLESLPPQAFADAMLVER